MTTAVVLTGAPGAGKSSVLEVLSTMLEVEGVSHGALETEQLARGLPWLSLDQWLPQLRAVLEIQKSLGRECFLVVATTETEPELCAVIDAIAADRVLVICLCVPSEVAARRVAEREPDAWPGKRALIEHAHQLADQIPSIPQIDVIVRTDSRKVGEAAAEVRGLLSARGLV